ncbi:MAG: hypothetical protein FWD49_07125 [Firmicutes bacterium]|nr:hypothetical protein [Bacillota bacterium]
MTMRQEATKYFSEIPDSKLTVLLPLLKEFAEDTYIIETDLTDKERRAIAKGMKAKAKGAPTTTLEEMKKERPPIY